MRDRLLGGHRIGDAAVDQQRTGHCGEGLEQRVLRPPTRDRIEVRDVALVATEPLAERASQRERVSCFPLGQEHRVGGRVVGPVAAARPHRAPRPEVERGNHPHANVPRTRGV